MTVMVMRGVRVFLSQKLRIDIQDGVQVEAADVDDLLEIRLAEVDGLDLGPGIDMDDAMAQSLIFGFGNEVFFRHQDPVGKADLFLRLRLLVQRLHAVLGVHDGDHGIQAVVFGDLVIHEKRLAYRARVGHASRFDDDALKVELAVLAALAQIGQRAHEVTAYGAADAAIGQLDDFLVLILHQQIVVDALGPELVFNHGNALAVVFGQNTFEQRRFACTEKSGQDRHWNHVIDVFRGIHESASIKSLQARSSL